MKIIGSVYSQRFTIDILLSVLVVSMLAALGLETFTRFKTAAELTEPLMFAWDARVHNQINLAFTGKPIDNNDFQRLEIDKHFQHSIKASSITKQGHLELTLVSNKEDVNNQQLGFSLGRYSPGNAYQFVNWRCSHYFIDAYTVTNAAVSTLPPAYLDPICRR